MKFYAVHELTLKKGNAGIIKVYVEPTYAESLPKPEIQGFAWEGKRTQVSTNYYKNLDEVESIINNIYAHQSELSLTKNKKGNKPTAYPDVIYVEDIITEGLEKLMISKEIIRAIMNLCECSYSIAMLKLLCAKRPSLPFQYFGDVDSEKFKKFCFLNSNRKFSFFGIKNQTNSFFKYVAEAFEIPVEIFLEYDLEFYQSKSNLKELIKVFELLNDVKELNDKFSDFSSLEKEKMINRFIAINCVMIVNNLNQTTLAKANDTSKLTISKYLYNPASLSKTFRNKINNNLIDLEPELQELL